MKSTIAILVLPARNALQAMAAMKHHQWLFAVLLLRAVAMELWTVLKRTVMMAIQTIPIPVSTAVTGFCLEAEEAIVVSRIKKGCDGTAFQGSAGFGLTVRLWDGWHT